MPELTDRQQKLFERLRHEGTVVLGGRERKTVEALVRQGIATYQAEYVLNEKHTYYAYRFTVRLTWKHPERWIATRIATALNSRVSASIR
jgi:hypothetical protein